jgi:hypothetical protein
MTLFLRNKENESVVDIELFIEKCGYVELKSVICLKQYSKLLLELVISEKSEKEIHDFINEFEDLSELRGWLWEDYFATKRNNYEEFENVCTALREKLKTVAKKYNLVLVQD